MPSLRLCRATWGQRPSWERKLRDLGENWGKLKEAIAPVAEVLLSGVTSGMQQFTNMLKGDIWALLRGSTGVIKEAIEGSLKSA